MLVYFKQPRIVFWLVVLALIEGFCLAVLFTLPGRLASSTLISIVIGTYSLFTTSILAEYLLEQAKKRQNPAHVEVRFKLFAVVVVGFLVALSIAIIYAIVIISIKDMRQSEAVLQLYGDVVSNMNGSAFIGLLGAAYNITSH